MELSLFFINISFLICILLHSVNSQFPSDINRCTYGDEKCFIAEFNRLIQLKFNGDPALGLVSLNPLKVNAIDIRQGAESAVNIDLSYRNSGLYGLQNLRLYKAKGFGRDLKGPHEFHAKSPSLSLVGDYTTKGRVLILPITGNGKSNVTLVKPNIIFHFDGKPIQKNGKTYFEIGKLQIRLKMDRYVSHYTNLFNGDKALGDNMNLFLNENWKDIWGELEDTVLKAFELIFKNVLQNVFNQFAYEEFFIQ